MQHITGETIANVRDLGHRTGVISQLYIDPTCSFLISTGGNRGYFGDSTEVLLGYEIMIPGR